MSNYLPVTADTKTIIERLQAASQDIGSGPGTGATFLKVDDRGGDLTFGQDRAKLPAKHRFVVGLQTFAHGYIDMQGGQVVERNVVPMEQQQIRPTPAKGYGTYGGGGPRNVTEITLNSIDEPGFNLVFTAWGASSANRLRTLLEESLRHVHTPDGQAGFVHPVIIPKSSHYSQSSRKDAKGEMIPARDVHHFDYTIVDWLHSDGSTLLSAGPSKEVELATWDDEEMTEDEATVLGAT